MEIGPLSNQQPEKRTAESKGAKQEKPQPERSQAPRDRLEISEAARARLGELADSELRSEQSPPIPVSEANLDGAEKLDAIRKRIESGYYQRTDISGKTAEKFLGDLEA